jgi:hypothetical protein
MTTESASSPVTLPAGVAIGPGRETSQTNPQGQVVQGMVFPITLPNGSTTTVFIPYSQITNTQWVQEQFAQRVGSILAITG